MSTNAKMIEEIKKMSVVELAELIKAIETEFGVSAAAPVAVAGGSAAVGIPVEATTTEKAEFKVTLKDGGAEKIKAIKALREAATALGKTIGLKEAKDMVEGAPAVIFESAPKDEAKKMKEALEAVGAKVELS